MCLTWKITLISIGTLCFPFYCPISLGPIRLNCSFVPNKFPQCFLKLPSFWTCLCHLLLTNNPPSDYVYFTSVEVRDNTFCLVIQVPTGWTCHRIFGCIPHWLQQMASWVPTEILKHQCPVEAVLAMYVGSLSLVSKNLLRCCSFSDISGVFVYLIWTGQCWCLAFMSTIPNF